MTLVNRPYTHEELARIKADIAQTTTRDSLLITAIKGMYAPLLADLGHTWESYTADSTLNPSEFVVLKDQLEEIMNAAMAHAQTNGFDAIGVTNIGLDLINYQPSYTN